MSVMEVIVLRTTKNLGKLGEKIKVKSGYARNYLIPNGKVVVANEDNIKYFDEKLAELKEIAAKDLAEAEVRAEKIKELNITMQARSSAEGKLYGSITEKHIEDYVKKHNIAIDRKEIKIADGHIRHLGTHDVTFDLHNEVNFVSQILVQEEK